MNILSLQLGHNATVGLFQDGKIKALVSQERFDYIKNSKAFPKDAIKWIMDLLNLNGEDIDVVAVAGLFIYPNQMNIVRGRASLVSSTWAYLDYKCSSIADIIRALYKPVKQLALNKAKELLYKQLEKFGIAKNKVVFVEHHLCHAYTPYFGFLGGKKAFTLLTLDGAGDFYSATVGVGKEGIYKRLSTTPIKASLGYIYSTTTQFLGMKPLEHEYKVMGLAPYAKEKYAKKVYEKFKQIIWLREDGLTFDSKFPTSRFGIYLKENLCGERFDNIAYAVQKLTEQLITQWVRNAINKTGINRVATSGGVFMNVKANMLLAYMEEIDEIFFTPSAGDESNPIGAAYYTYLHHLKGDPKKIKPIKDLYLGPSFSNDEIEEFIKKKELKRKYKVSYYKDIEGVIAELIAKGEVVARFAGRAEWGARALGNRTILADPSKMESFFKVNDQIKMRDFWMPFAPTMLNERADEYIENPYKRKAPYMILAFRSTEEGRKYFKAAMHQADKTLRPQILEKSWNPKYYKIIKEFENITGIGGVLNTSFNLHGKPIATFPWQALDVFEHSKLKYLAMENWLIEK